MDAAVNSDSSLPQHTLSWLLLTVNLTQCVLNHLGRVADCRSGWPMGMVRWELPNLVNLRWEATRWQLVAPKYLHSFSLHSELETNVCKKIFKNMEMFSTFLGQN